jgi:glycosyltransferase involved in cell wall biosynthesis
VSRRAAVSVVVCSRDRPTLLAHAVASIRPELDSGDELVVVDSASLDRITTIVTGESPSIVRLDDPGLSRARNAGVDATKCDVVAFTDDDCVVVPGWLDAIAAAFADPRVGVVMGRVLPFSEGAPSPADDPGDAPFTFGVTATVDELGAGANMAFRRAALADIGGFDELLGAGTRLRSGEDHDAVWRVLRAGWTGKYQPEARVAHRDWRSPWALMAMRYRYGLGAGANAAKLMKVDPYRGWHELRRRAWDKGVSQSLRHLARGWERPAVGDALYTAGVLIGAAVAWTRPLDHGRLGATR